MGVPAPGTAEPAAAAAPTAAPAAAPAASSSCGTQPAAWAAPPPPPAAAAEEGPGRGPAAASSAPAGELPRALLAAFLAAQRERAAAYHALDAAHRAYMQSGAEGPLRFTMQRCTGAFQACSMAVRAAAGGLAAAGQGEAAALLRGVQEREREKLSLTLALQALKAAHARRQFSWQWEEGEGERAADQRSPGAIARQHSSHHHHHQDRHHACGGAGRCPGAPQAAVATEPTRAEWEAAGREATQELQACVTAINEAIEEVVQLRIELLDAGDEGEEGR